MWQMILGVSIFVIFRYLLKLYLQKSALEEILEEEQSKTEVDESAESKKDTKLTKSEAIRLLGSSLKDVQEAEVDDEEITDSKEEDYDDNSTGHNVTKILTATTSRRLNLSPQQMETRDKVNKELMERLAKRKIHDE